MSSKAWNWKTEWCKRKGLAPHNNEVWDQASQAYLENLDESKRRDLMSDEIRVISKGKPKSELLARFTCANCDTFMEAPRSAGQLNMSYQGEWVTFKCPTCGTHVSVDLDDFKYEEPYGTPRRK